MWHHSMPWRYDALVWLKDVEIVDVHMLFYCIVLKNGLKQKTYYFFHLLYNGNYLNSACSGDVDSANSKSLHLSV